MLPPSAFGDDPIPAPAPGKGAFFWVFHEFKEGLSKQWWEIMAPTLSDKAKFAEMVANHNALGFNNHTFIPASPEGPVVCVWETKEDMSPEDFQKFIDGPDGPSAGIGAFTNTVYKSAGGMHPSAHFKA